MACPDLNPVEYFRDFLFRKVEIIKPSSVEALRQLLRAGSWKANPIETIQIHPMLRRCALVIVAKGLCTNCLCYF